LLVVLLAALLASAAVASFPDVDYAQDFPETDLEEEVLLDEAPEEEEEAEEENEDEDDSTADEEDLQDEQSVDMAENDTPDHIDVHVYLPVPAGAKQTDAFPAWPGSGAAPAPGAAADDGNFLSNSIGVFQSKVAAIVQRLKKEKTVLDKEDQRLDAHLAAIKAKIAKAKATIAAIKKEDSSEKAAAIAAANAKALRDKMRSHPILSKLYAARKFVIELKRMVRALRTMNPNSLQYAKTMGKIQQKMADAKANGGTGLADLDEMLQIGDISDIQISKVRDDEVAGLNGVLCAMMKHIQAKINYWEAKIRADHERELGASAASRDARLAAARKDLRDAQAALANYEATMKERHMKIKAQLRRINAELTQLGAIDGHVTKYRRSTVDAAEAAQAAQSKAPAEEDEDEEEEW